MIALAGYGPPPPTAGELITSVIVTFIIVSVILGSICFVCWLFMRWRCKAQERQAKKEKALVDEHG